MIHPSLRPIQRSLPRTATLVLFACASLSEGQVFTDDFNDGNDAGWTQSSPLGGLGSEGTFTFPDGNSYRIRTDTPSPNPEVLGKARAGTYREDVNQSAFKISVDLVAWSEDRVQDFGILARINNPGLGTLDGYSLSYDSNSGGIFLNLLLGEAPNALGSASVFLEPGRPYRLVFHGFNGDFLGQVFDLDDLAFPLAEAFGFDGESPTVERGFPGLFNSGLTNDVVTVALSDSTFDNFRASPNPDTDIDSLSDPWEATYFGTIFAHDGDDDPDRDGRDNAAEHTAGTNPADATSLFSARSVTLDGGTLTVTVSPAYDDRTYTLELAGGTLAGWTPASETTQVITDGVLTISTATAGPAPGFARVSVSYDP